MLRLFNTLHRKIEDFRPLHPPKVGMYTCGPTVYDFAHIGNFRTYTTSDLLYRTLVFNGFDVTHVMNITDVGHLTGDNLGDADTGEDRMEKSSKKEGKSAWDIAAFYTAAFLKDYERLNLTKPKHLTKATDHIPEQIALVQKLEEKGYTYKTSDGIYFDTAKFPEYGKLSHLDQIKEGARVEINPEKKNPKDFALWKFSYPQGKSQKEYASSFDLAQAFGSEAQARRDGSVSRRHMEWDSPWGKGFPGWHIECSAMSMKYLGESFDLHLGGIDLSETHHPNEIAQSEAATGKSFVAYWVHGAFILVDGKRMSKSLGNNYTVQDVIEKGFDPLALRYLYMQTHYRQEMNFTWEALRAAQHAQERLYDAVAAFEKPAIGCAGYEGEFFSAINDDLNMPKALAVVWELLKSDYPTHAKAASLLRFDEVLGLGLKNVKTKKREEAVNIPDGVLHLVQEREALRAQKKFHLADQVRNKIKKMGFVIQDTEDGKTSIEKKR